jgi:hypothetical protein
MTIGQSEVHYQTETTILDATERQPEKRILPFSWC